MFFYFKTYSSIIISKTEELYNTFIIYYAYIRIIDFSKSHSYVQCLPKCYKSNVKKHYFSKPFIKYSLYINILSTIVLGITTFSGLTYNPVPAAATLMSFNGTSPVDDSLLTSNLTSIRR